VRVKADAVKEGDEAFILELTRAVNAVIKTGKATCVIHNA